MSYAAEVEAIVERFIAGTSIAAVDYPAGNLPGSGGGGVFETPTVDPEDPDAAIWARLTIAPVPRAVAPLAGVTRPGPVGLGPDAPTYREGLIVVQHFAPRASGGGLLGKVDETRSIFDRASFGPVVCRDTESPDPAGYDEGEWYQINTTTPYYVMEALEEAGVTDRVRETYDQAAHGASVGSAVSLTASGIVLAQADSSTTLAVGVVSRVRSDDKLDVTHAGLATVSAHGLGAKGTALYLSQSTAGLLTATAPTTGIRQRVATVWDVNTLFVQPQAAEQLS